MLTKPKPIFRTDFHTITPLSHRRRRGEADRLHEAGVSARNIINEPARPAGWLDHACNAQDRATPC